MAGSMYFVVYDKGIQLFPIVVNDERVKNIEVTVFGETKTAYVEETGFILLTFENEDMSLNNKTEAKAYDAEGKVLYTLGQIKGYWTWLPVE